MEPRLLIEQKITSFVNKYKISAVNDAGEGTELRALAQQKRLAFREKVIFYTDEQKSATSFTFRAEKLIDVHGSYLVEDADGHLLGMFKKHFAKSLLNSTWKVMDASDTELFLVKESSEIIAILRRFLQYVPFVGPLLELVMIFYKYHFVFIDIASGQEVGRYKKTTLLRDHYTLFMTDEAFSRVDERVVAAMAVALDALQSR